MKYVWNTYGICMGYGWNMRAICMKYVRNMCGIRMEYKRNVNGACHAYPGPRPTLMKPVCRLCVVSAPRKRGNALVPNSGSRHVGIL